MAHNPQVVETKQVNNEQVAYRIVCCDDLHESTWHTISVLTPDHDGLLEQRKAEVITRHEAMVQWRNKQSEGKV